MVKPIRLTAPEYINALCDWIESQVRPLLLNRLHLQAPIIDALGGRNGSCSELQGFRQVPACICITSQ